MLHGVTRESARFISRQRQQRASAVSSLHVVSAGKTKAWRWPGFGLARLNNFSRLWGMEVVPGCLLPGPGVVRMYSPARKGSREVLGGVDSFM